MSSLKTSFTILADCNNAADRKEQLYSLAKLLRQVDLAPSVMSLGALTNHLGNHYQDVDASNLSGLLGDANDIGISDDRLSEFDKVITAKLFNTKGDVPGVVLRSEKKVDFSKLFAEAAAPAIETGSFVPLISNPATARFVSPNILSNTSAPAGAPSLSTSQHAGVKRLGGFRPPVALPPPTTSSTQEVTANQDEDDDDEYEPDPKIRAKKQWRKQYDAAKKREAERKYNTPKYRDDVNGPKENVMRTNFSSSNNDFSQQPQSFPRQPQQAAPRAPPPPNNEDNRPTLGARPGFRPASKFVPPLMKKNDSGEQQPQRQDSAQGKQPSCNIDGAIKENFIKTALGAELQQQDERLKTLDPGMIELILSEIVDHGPKTEWEDVAGLETVKKNIMEVIVWPMLRPDLFRGIRGPPKGLLLFGPPGTGKTMIGKCIASQCNATFFSISASSLLSKWFGEAEKMVKTLFAVARTRQPAVIFIDEVDSMLCKRGQDDQECSRRIKTEFLVQLDGVTCGEDDRILMIGATNLPSELDEAARRRFAKRLYVALPSQPARVQIVRRLMGKMDKGQCALSQEDFEEVGRLSEGYSGSDMTNLCREAALGPLRSIEDISTANITEIRAVKLDDFAAALNSVRPSVAPKDLVELEVWNHQYGTINAQ